MLRLTVVVASLGLGAATREAHVAHLTQCVHRCEAKNECHASLDMLTCEESCEALCQCSAISRRMLNKPKHCMASMLEKHRKKLNLIRMKKATIKKVVLQDDDDAAPAKAAEQDFSSYVALEDYWPKGHYAEAAAKPRMLNSRKEMSLIRSKPMPWSAARHPHKHHRHAAALITKNVSAPANATKVNASVAAPALQKATPKAAPVKVALPAKVTTTNVTKAETPAKVTTPAKETPKVATPVKDTSKKAALIKVAAPAQMVPKKK